MAIIAPLKKAFNWETVHEKIQDTPLYKVDWLTMPVYPPVIKVNSWRGILDMENFPGNLLPPAPLAADSLKFSLEGPMVATERKNFYVQITPYYSRNPLGSDATVPYVLPVGIISAPTGISEFEIYNIGANGANNWTGEFYIYYELGVNYNG